MQSIRDPEIQKVLVVGSGGREAGIVWMLAQMPGVIIYSAPGNPGIGKNAICIAISATNIEGLLEFVISEDIDLTIVGPERVLVAGIVDRFRAEDRLICGPTAAAAQAEGSKAWFKRLCWKYDIPTAHAEIFTDKTAALAYAEMRGLESIVIKDDELRDGKGVTLPENRAEAEAALDEIKGTVLIEDRLEGIERSALAGTDGHIAQFLPFTQDYKRVGNGDIGPNTGSMGAHTIILPAEEEAEYRRILLAVLAAMATEGCPFTGFMYLGFMWTAEGAKVLECNCRIGDCDGQTSLLSTNGDLLAVCAGVARGDLSEVAPLTWVRHVVCVVLASAEYPAPSDRDDPITGIDAAWKIGGVMLDCGTENRDGEQHTNKRGRVYDSIGLSKSFADAHSTAYEAASNVQFPGVKYRSDIGAEMLTA